MTYKTFHEQIHDLRNHYQNRDLETYLLALLRLVKQDNAQNLNADSLLKLLQEAFGANPEAFNPGWLSIKTAPDENVMSKKFTNPEIDPPFDKSVVSNRSGIDYAIAVLQFQIAELHKMKGKQLDNDMRYFGVESETGNLWYNFDPMTNLECGASCMLNSQADEDGEFKVSWQTLGELLEMGRIYE